MRFNAHFYTAARILYEQETINYCWSERERNRQIGRFLFDGIQTSKDKKKIMSMINKNQEMTKTKDVLRGQQFYKKTTKEKL